jgi:hypothetical protein
MSPIQQSLSSTIDACNVRRTMTTSITLFSNVIASPWPHPSSYIFEIGVNL